MGAILDLIGSYVFKAAMVGIILSTSISLNNVMTEKRQLTILEKTMNVGMSVVEWDLRNIGYNYFSVPFTTASANDMQYYTDANNDGSIEVVRWRVTGSRIMVGDSSVMRYALVRTFGGNDMVVMPRLRSVSFQYYDRSGAATAILSEIRGIRVSVETEASVVVDGRIPTARREFTIYPSNLMLF